MLHDKYQCYAALVLIFQGKKILSVKPYIFALASSLAYQNQEVDIRRALASRTQQHGQWQYFRVDPQANPYDHHAIVIRNVQTKVAIIAHRGTNSMAHLLNDWSIFQREVPQVIEASMSYSRQIRALLPDYTIYETGHSMGAIFAEYNAHRFQCEAVTFESPGCREALEADRFIHQIRDDLVTTYLAAPNGINVAGKHVGQLIRLFVPYIRNGGCQLADVDASILKHALSTVLIRLLALPFSNHANYVKQQHSMTNLLQCFDSELGEPTLQRVILRWPTLVQYTNWILSADTYDFWAWFDATIRVPAGVRRYNQQVEGRLANCGVTLGGFLTLTALRCADDDYQRYCMNAHHRFDDFYANVSLRNVLSQQLGVGIPYQPLQRGQGENIMPLDNAKSRETKSVLGAAVVGAVLGGGAAYAHMAAAPTAIAVITEAKAAELSVAIATKAATMAINGASAAKIVAAANGVTAGVAEALVTAVSTLSSSGTAIAIGTVAGALVGAIALGYVGYRLVNYIIEGAEKDVKAAEKQNELLREQNEKLDVANRDLQAQVNRQGNDISQLFVHLGLQRGGRPTGVQQRGNVAMFPAPAEMKTGTNSNHQQMRSAETKATMGRPG